MDVARYICELAEDRWRKSARWQKPTSPSQQGSLIQDRGAAVVPGGRWLELISGSGEDLVSSPWGTLSALTVIAAWLVAAPFRRAASRTWGLMDEIFSASSFLLLFLLNAPQTKAPLAIRVKLNELLAAAHRASPELINVEDRTESEVQEIHDRFQEIQQRGRAYIPSRISSTEILRPRCDDSRLDPRRRWPAGKRSALEACMSHLSGSARRVWLSSRIRSHLPGRPRSGPCAAMYRERSAPLQSGRQWPRSSLPSGSRTRKRSPRRHGQHVRVPVQCCGLRDVCHLAVPTTGRTDKIRQSGDLNAGTVRPGRRVALRLSGSAGNEAYRTARGRRRQRRPRSSGRASARPASVRFVLAKPAAASANILSSIRCMTSGNQRQAAHNPTTTTRILSAGTRVSC